MNLVSLYIKLLNFFSERRDYNDTGKFLLALPDRITKDIRSTGVKISSAQAL